MAPKRLLIVSLFILLASSACEDSRADKAYVRGNYGKTVKELQFLADNGEPRAQYDLGLMYDRGDGVAQSDANAKHWYERAAEQGEPRAQYNLGLMYLNGQGIPQDVVMAHYWISLSANRGDAHARDARDYVAEKMSIQQIAESKRLIDDYEEQAAKAKACVFCNPANPSY